MQNIQEEGAVLRRTGVVIILLGVAQVLLGFAGAPAGTFHLQLLNLNIIAGILIAFGNLRAASAIRWLAWFGLLPTALFLIADIALLPASLLLAQLHFIPRQLAIEYGGQTLTLAVIVYSMRQLGSAPVLQARAAVGRKVRNMRIPLVLGGLLAVAGIAFETRALHSPEAAHAAQLAMAQAGPGYEYFTNRINFQVGEARSVRATVQVWNTRELREIPVRWVR